MAKMNYDMHRRRQGHAPMVVTPRARTFDGAVRARFPSTCATCDEPIRKGSLIVKGSGRGWIHWTCSKSEIR